MLKSLMPMAEEKVNSCFPPALISIWCCGICLHSHVHRRVHAGDCSFKVHIFEAAIANRKQLVTVSARCSDYWVIGIDIGGRPGLFVLTTLQGLMSIFSRTHTATCISVCNRFVHKGVCLY